MIRRAVGRSTVVFVAIAAIAVAMMGAFALGSVPSVAQTTTSTTSTSSSIPWSTTSGSGQGETFLVQVVNGPAMTPLAGVTVTAGPASSPEDIVDTPGGPPLSMYSGYLPAPLTSNLGIQISGVAAGRTYTFTVACTFADESTSTQTFSLTAQY